MTKNIAIIGAGLSGLTLAHELQHNYDVTVFEKSRQVGGRMATRNAHPFVFDHGAQCFTARGPAFRRFLQPHTDMSVIREWTGNVVNLETGKSTTRRLWLEPHLVACPNMNSLCKNIARKLNVKNRIEVAPLNERKADTWVLRTKNDDILGCFNWVISTAPPAQSLNLFQSCLQTGSMLHHAKMHGCIALMLGFDKTTDTKWIAAKIRNNPIKWISVNSSKPGRNNTVTCLVAHTRSAWSEKHIDHNTNTLQSILINHLSTITGMNCHDADHVALHKWRYALVKKNHKAGYFLDHHRKIAATGDWSVTSRIEEVWWNASALAKKLKSLRTNNA